MFCRECGSEVRKNAKVCPSCGGRPFLGTKHCQACGSKTKFEQKLCNKCGAHLISKGSSSEDDTPKIAKVASCCMPVVGLILFFIWRSEKPESAKSVCNWTILGLAGGMVLYSIGLVSGVFSSLLGY